MPLSEAFVNHFRAGPFPAQVDPWAEVGNYFHQIHGGMIGKLAEQLEPRLMQMGYIVGREASLQILGGREPDLFVQSALAVPPPRVEWNYELAAAELLAEPGEVIEDEVRLDALHIKEIGSGRLVTVIELISPSNKDSGGKISLYHTNRNHVLFGAGAHVVEIDLTRSVKRLLTTPQAQRYPYHVAIFMLGSSPRFIGMELRQPLKRIALPLRGEAFPIDLQAAYDGAYQLFTVAPQIFGNGHYEEAHLPFPSLLGDVQTREALAAVQTWKTRLEELRGESHG